MKDKQDIKTLDEKTLETVKGGMLLPAVQAAREAARMGDGSVRTVSESISI